MSSTDPVAKMKEMIKKVGEQKKLGAELSEVKKLLGELEKSESQAKAVKKQFEDEPDEV